MEADAAGAGVLGSEIELLQTAFCICFSSLTTARQKNTGGKEQAWVREIASYLSGHKKMQAWLCMSNTTTPKPRFSKMES